VKFEYNVLPLDIKHNWDRRDRFSYCASNLSGQGAKVNIDVDSYGDQSGELAKMLSVALTTRTMVKVTIESIELTPERELDNSKVLAQAGLLDQAKELALRSLDRINEARKCTK
jgi:hypothetical protein